MSMATVSPKGWIVIPVALRKKYDLHPGANVAIVDYGGALAIVPAADDPVQAARGLLKGDMSLVNALLEERSQERSRER